MNKVLIIIITFVFFTSCNSSNTSTELDGLCSNPITVSENDIVFSAEENTVTVTSESGFGWINSIEFNDLGYDYDSEILASSQFLLEEDVFTIERNAQTLSVKIYKNDTENERFMFIGLQSGNCVGSLRITQEAN